MKDLLQEKGVGLRFKDPEDQNALAVVDRAGGVIKGIQYRMLQEANASKWIDKLPAVILAYNSSNHSTVGAPPKDVEGNEVLTHLLIKANCEKVEHNAEAFLRNKKNMEPASKFRVLTREKSIRGLRRGFKPNYSGKVYIAKGFPQNGRQVQATTGEIFAMKLVLPVPETSKTVGTQVLDRIEERRHEQTVAARAAKK